MSQGPPPLPDQADPATAYTVVCLCALGVVLLAELERLTLLTLVALLVGLGGVLARTPVSPMLFLVLIGMSQILHKTMMEGFGGWQGRAWALRPSDGLLALGGLAFVAGHYRLQGLTRHLFPTDARQRLGPSAWDWWSLGRSAPLLMHRRSPEEVSGGEFAWLAASGAVAALLGAGAWVALATPRLVFGLPPPLGRFALAAWCLGVGWFVVAGLLGYWRRTAMNREQALLILQDEVWKHTRREQRALQRDAARTRWRWAKRKDGP